MTRDGLEELERVAGAMLASLDAGKRRGVLRKMALALAASQRRRIGRQREPDGSAFAPRKTRRAKGSLRRNAMFRTLASGRFLRAGADDGALWVGFTGRAAQIASVHQNGLRDRPTLRAKAVPYARRELLGTTEADRGLLVDTLLKHIADD